MPISRLVPASATLLLASCATGVSLTAPNRADVDVAGERVAIVAPPGFCIDPAATASGPDGAFAMITDCTLLGEPGGSTPPVAAMLTASIAPDPELVAEGGESTLDDLEAFLATARGRAGLGRSGDADATRIVQSTRREEVLYVLVEDRGPSPLPGVEPRFWRAFMMVNGRLAGLSIQGFDRSAPGLGDQLRILATFAASLRAANPFGWETASAGAGAQAGLRRLSRGSL